MTVYPTMNDWLRSSNSGLASDDPELFVFVTPHVHLRRNAVFAVFVTVSARQVTVTVALAVCPVCVIVATLVNEAFAVGHGNVCVGLKVPVLGFVTVPSATAPVPSKL